MTDFRYVARTRDDTIQKGTIVASDKAAAMSTLSSRELTPILIKQKRGGGNFFSNLISKLQLDRLNEIELGGVKTKDKVIMSRQLSTMVNAGVPIVQALVTLQAQTESKKLKRVLGEVAKEVKGGRALSDALEKHPKIFTPVFTNMVRAGEAGGILDQILERIALQTEKDAEIKSKVRGAMIYPGIITSITFIAFMFLMVVIVPKLKTVFDQFGSELPANTRIMLAISNFIVAKWWVVILGIGLLAFAFIKLIRTKKGKRMFDKLLLKTPVVGMVVMKVNVARFARTFSSLSEAGVSVLDSIRITRESLGNSVIRDGLIRSAEKVKNGETIAASLGVVDAFPPIVKQMAAVGEETGEVDKVLNKIADFYEKEVDRVISNLTSVIEPLLIIILGGMVGLIVSSVFGPISSLSDVVSQ